jgi:DNA-binding winged helix-turn-helix (wHTH) protein/tetratricopeptide (TPR) repeat protein
MYRFDDFQLDPARFRLLRDGAEVPLEPRALDLLVFLVENRGRVVTRQELRDEVWEGQHVEDGALSQAVHSLRAALGDDPREPRFVLTVRGRGYRFAGEVEVEEAGGEGPPETATADAGVVVASGMGTRGRSSRALIVAAGAILAAVVAIVLLRDEPRATHEVPMRSGSLGILPLVNATGDDSLHWVELGLVDLLGRTLDGAGGIALVPVTEAVAVLDRLKTTGTAEEGGDERLEALSRATGARWLVSTVLTRDEGIFRMRATLVTRGERPRSDTLSGGDLFALTEALSDRIRTWLGTQDDTTLAERAPLDYPEDPELRRLFATGMHEQLRGDAKAALRFFDLVLAADPGQMAAGYERAIALRKLGDVEGSKALAETLLADALADGAIRIEGKARNLLGILQWMGGDLEAAQSHLEGSLEIHRRLALRRAQISNLTNLGILASGRGEWTVADGHYEEALALCAETEVPCPGVYNSLGVLAWTQGDVERSGRMHEEALALRRRTGDRRGEATSLNNLGTVARALGRLGKAEELFGQALALRRELEDRRGTASTLGNLADLAFERGHFSRAENLAAEALGLASDSGFELERARILGIQQDLASARREWARARELSDRRLELLRARDERPLITSELGRRIELELEAGDQRAAEARAAVMVELARGLASVLADAQVAAARSRLELARGSTKEGLTSLSQAIELAREARHPSFEQDLTARLSEALIEHGALAEARRRLASVGAAGEASWRIQWIHGRLALAEGDPQRALESVVRARELAGDHWGSEQEAFHEAVLRAVDGGSTGPPVASPAE